MKMLVDKVHNVVEQVSHITQEIRKKKNANETVWLIQGTYNIYTNEAEEQNETQKKAHIFEVINPKSHNAIQLFRERLSEKMCTWQSRRVIWDMINTLFLTTVAVETNFFTFLWHSQTYVRGLPCNSFKFLWRTGHSKLPTIPFGVVACTFSDNLSRNTCIRNAQGGPLISVFHLVSGFISNSLSHWILVSRRMLWKHWVSGSQTCF